MSIKEKFEYWSWEDTIAAIVLSAVTFFIILCIYALSQDHKVRFYYLDSMRNELRIKGDINWGEDNTIMLDRNLTYTEAIEMIEKLNNNLNKNK